EEAQEDAAFPLADAWEETRALIYARSDEADVAPVSVVLADATDRDDSRLRLRALLRRLISRVRLVGTSRNQDRMLAAEIRFRDGHVRLLKIFHRPPRSNQNGRKPGKWWAVTGRYDDPIKGVPDFRTPEGVAQMLEVLEEWCPDEMRPEELAR